MCYILYASYYILSAIYYLLDTIYYILYTICYLLYTIYYTMIYNTMIYNDILYYTITYYTILYCNVLQGVHDRAHRRQVAPLARVAEGSARMQEVSGSDPRLAGFRGKSIPSLWRDRRPPIKGLWPPEHHAGQFHPDQKDSSESKTTTKMIEPTGARLVPSMRHRSVYRCACPAIILYYAMLYYSTSYLCIIVYYIIVYYVI